MTPWVVFLGSLALLILLSGWGLLRKAKLVRTVVLCLLAAMAGTALVDIFLGEWLVNGIEGLAGWVGGWSDTPATLIVSLSLLVIVVAVFIALTDGKADRKELIGIVLIPALIVAAAGSGISGEGSQLVASFESLGDSVFSELVS